MVTSEQSPMRIKRCSWTCLLKRQHLEQFVLEPRMDAARIAQTADTLPKFRGTVAERKTQPCITFVETRSGPVICFSCARRGWIRRLDQINLVSLQILLFLQCECWSSSKTVSPKSHNFFFDADLCCQRHVFDVRTSRCKIPRIGFNDNPKL